MGILSKLYNASLHDIYAHISRRLRKSPVSSHRNELQKLFSKYKTDALKGISPADFESILRSKLGSTDPLIEGYSSAEIENQRDFSIKFTWGHNHDFGTFKLQGEMKDRHLILMDNFCSLFPIKISDFSGKEVLDIGCWTGGTTLLLAALGARVTAIEEVKKYADTTTFLARSFDIDAEVKPLSLYALNNELFYDKFDIIYFPGVIYHLSDPLIALRILFNACKINGSILVETAGIDVTRPDCRFAGSLQYGPGSAEQLNRNGWNWFVPSQSALYRMMREAGFADVQTYYLDSTRRVYGYGIKKSKASICRAGLSIPDIR